MQRQRFAWLAGLVVSLMVLAAGSAKAVTAGKIIGKVTDAQTGEGVLGAAVTVEGLRMGAVTDGDGRYFILSVPAGRHTLKIQMIGYSPVTQLDVLVNNDLTTRADFRLRYQAVEVGEVTVIAERPLIEKTLTGTRRTTLREQLELMPVVTSDDIYRAAPGIVFDPIGGPVQQVTDGTIRVEDETRTGNTANPGYYIRGSRPGEVNYYLDNIPVSSVLALPGKAIQETNLLTGGFGAQYGNGTSIINTVTPTPGASYSASLNWESDVIPGAVSKRYDYGTNVVTATVGGAIPGTNNRLRVWLLGDGNMSDDWDPHLFPQDADFIENGIREFTQRDNMVDTLRTFWGNIKPWDVFAGDRLVLPAHSQDMYTGMGKMIYNAGPFEFTASGFAWRRQYQRYTPNGLFMTWDKNNFVGAPYATTIQQGSFLERRQAAFAVRWSVSPRTIFDLKVSYSTNATTRGSLDLKSGSFGLLDDYDYAWHSHAISWSPFYADAAGQAERAEYQQQRREVYYPLGVTNLFFTSGNSRLAEAVKGNSWVGELHGTSQINNNHEISGGVEITRGETRQDRLSDPWSGTPFFDNWGPFNPIYGAAFLQDKIEYEGLTVTAGVRMDYYDPDASIWSDPLKPGAGSLMPDGVTINTTGRPDVNADPVNAFRDKKVKAKVTASPRLGISHPVSDRALVYFNYGHFVTQNANPYESYVPDLGRSNSRLGNPDLPFMRTISYEVGYTHEIFNSTKLDVVLYRRDMTNTNTYQRVPAMDGAYTYAMASPTMIVNGEQVNIGYGNSKGVEVILTRYRDAQGMFSGWVSYSYLKAEAIYSDANDAYERFSRSALDPETGRLQYPPDVPGIADYDRTHSFKGSFDIRLRQGFGPQVAGMYPLQNMGINILEVINAGLPYTRISQGGKPIGINNEFRKPWTFETDLMLNKQVTLADVNMSVYMKVENVFDRRNVQNIYERTGNPIDDGRVMPQAQPNSTSPASPNWVYEGVKDGIDGSVPDGRISIAEDEAAYRKAWSIYARDPLFFSNPRIIRVGVGMSF
jgi:hypothetical protein